MMINSTINKSATILNNITIHEMQFQINCHNFVNINLRVQQQTVFLTNCPVCLCSTGWWGCSRTASLPLLSITVGNHCFSKTFSTLTPEIQDNGCHLLHQLQASGQSPDPVAGVWWQKWGFVKLVNCMKLQRTPSLSQSDSRVFFRSGGLRWVKTIVIMYKYLLGWALREGGWGWKPKNGHNVDRTTLCNSAASKLKFKREGRGRR